MIDHSLDAAQYSFSSEWTEARDNAVELRKNLTKAMENLYAVRRVLDAGFKDVLMTAAELSKLHDDYELASSGVAVLAHKVNQAERKVRKIVVKNSMAATGSNEAIAVGAL